MSHVVVEEYLKHIGFSEKEVDVYKYLLSVEHSTPLTISKETKIKRSTVYVALSELVKKKLIRETEHGNKSVFVAEDPEHIRTLLEAKKAVTNTLSQSFDEFLPRMRSLMRQSGEVPLLKFYQGQDAVKKSMMEFAETPGLQQNLDYGVFSLDILHRLFGTKNWLHYMKRRIKDDKVYKAIYNSHEGELPTSVFEESIHVDDTEYPITCDIGVYQDQVRIHMMGKNAYGICIVSKELAETLGSIIRLAMKNKRDKKTEGK